MMEWNCKGPGGLSPSVLERGSAFLRKNRLIRKTRTRRADGNLLLRAKAVDSFNFVNRPWLLLDPAGREVLRCGCDCAGQGQAGEICEHCAALAWEHSGAQSAPEQPEVPAPEVPDLPDPMREAPEGGEEEADLSPAPARPRPEEASAMPQEPSAAVPEEPALPQEHRTMRILFGTNLDDGSPVFWLPNDTERVFHTNTGIIGTMGTGKTQFTKSLVTQLYRSQRDNFDGRPLGILIFDYKGDYNETKADFVAAVNARVYKPCRLPYNPLTLNRPRSFKPLLPMHTANEFQTTLAKIYHLGPKQQQVLLDCILKAYAQQGIEPANPATWGRRAPTFDQVYRIFARESAGRTVDSLTAAMNKLHHFCLFEDDPNRAQPLADMLRGVVVIDLSGYDSDIQSLIIAITLDQFYAQMQACGSSATDGRFRQLRNLILVDEADGFLSQRFPSLRKIMKEGREFGVGVILSTQSLSHFVGDDDDYSRYVLTWVVHSVSDIRQRDLEYVFKFQPKDPDIAACYARVKGLKKHESVVKVSNEAPVAIRDRAFWELCRDGNGGSEEK